MHADALKQAKVAYNRAREAGLRIQNATSMRQIEAAWPEVLGLTSRVYEKLKAGARSNDRSAAWYGQRSAERSSDELLSYMLHARNADHHRFESVTVRRGGGLGIGAAGTVHVDNLVLVNDSTVQVGRVTPRSPGSSLRLTSYPSTVYPLPVMDRGVTYGVPRTHLGRSIASPSVLTLASRTMYYLKAMVEDADSLTR